METNNEAEEIREEGVSLPSIQISDGGGVSIFIIRVVKNYIFELSQYNKFCFNSSV